jgi:type VI protein secretion system component Hcp
MKNNYFILVLFMLISTTSISFAQGIFLYHPTVTKGMGVVRPDEIEINSYQFGVSRSISAGAGKNRVASMPSLTEISIVKRFDKTSNKIAQLATNGAVDGNPYEIRFYGSGDRGGEPVLTLRIKLYDVLFSSYSQASAECGGDCPDMTEAMTLNFTKIVIENVKDKGSSADYIWNIETGKAN